MRNITQLKWEQHAIKGNGKGNLKYGSKYDELTGSFGKER